MVDIPNGNTHTTVLELNMDSATDDDDTWTGGFHTPSAGDDEPTESALDPRSYQREMFDYSMKENIIACMATGSGKTMVARLRIEAELQRTPGKRIWFMTPNVVLAEQQHAFLASQLPSYSFKLITGADNVQFWSSQPVWDAALGGQHGVISTPEVLRAALIDHAFVSLQDMSLLVFDEAHHCMSNHPTNLVMQASYHPLRSSSPDAIPAILDLTASPIMQNQITAMGELEQNLNAVCRAPSQNLEEYQYYVHMPELQRLEFTELPGLGSQSTHLLALDAVIANYDILKDPTYTRLSEDASVYGMDKFNKIIQKRETPVLKELRRFRNQADHLQQQLGCWASGHYISTCVRKLDAMNTTEGLLTIGDEENRHLHKTLAPVKAAMSAGTVKAPGHANTSRKVIALVELLSQEYKQATACIVFADRRATVWALNELLALQLTTYRCFGLVGTSSAFGQGLADLVDKRKQQSALTDFRQGLLNLCIATSVLEEGIDVQACNMVVCFDDSKNVKSFIQRRGRARRAGSKYIIMHNSIEAIDKYARYEVLEEQMKKAYAEQDRHVAEMMVNEELEEHCDRKYRVATTGAVLTISQARAHLQHFCNTLPRREGRSTPDPVFIVDGIPGEQVSCRVILPSSVPVHLQTASSLGKWRTEKMAKKDAAYEAYVALHKHGLLTDHLLPPAIEKLDTAVEGRDSMYEVEPMQDPWRPPRRSTASSVLHAHRIVIHDGDLLPNLLLLLPLALETCQDVVLHIAPDAKLTVATNLIEIQCYDIDRDFLAQITKFLFCAVLKRRLPGIDHSDFRLPYYLIPDVPPKDLLAWVRESQLSLPANNFDFQNVIQPSLLIQRKGDSVPYFYALSADFDVRVPSTTNDEIEVTRLSRQIDFLKPIPGALPNLKRIHQLEDCTVSGLSPGFARVMAFIPSIMHTIEIALHAHAACTSGPLKDLAFRDHRHVTAALTAPGAGQVDYQRLEYIGDSLLKYLTTVNIYCLNPYMPESQLSLARDRVISNGRLQRVTRDLGLDAYLTTKPFSAHEWTLADREEAARMLSTKTLADVVEALIGAACADTPALGLGDLSKVMKCLTLFLPEIQWQEPLTAVTTLSPNKLPRDLAQDRLHDIEGVLGYSFLNKGLLPEALTHSTVQVGVQSYERLEFLGDAVIDIIVKDKLWNSPLEMTEGQMTARHSSLVNKDIFAYLTTKLVVEKQINDVSVDPRTRRANIQAQKKEICLHDYMSRLSNRDMSRQREKLMSRFDMVKDTLERELRTAKVFPWSTLYHLASPKWCSDVLESIIGAVYIDSGASLEVCETVLRKMGLMDLVDRAATESDVIYAQALVRLREVIPALKVGNKKTRDGDVLLFSCRLVIEEDEVGRYVGASCQSEAENRAAEVVLKKIGNGELVIKKKEKVGQREIDSDDGREDYNDNGAETVQDGDVNTDDLRRKRKRSWAGLCHSDVHMNEQ